MQYYLPSLKQMQYLVALHEHGHFGRAADACNVTQSTLSAGIRELETLLGQTLVERTRRVVRFTGLGDAIVEKAHRVLREAEELADMAAAASAPLVGELRMSVIPTIAPFLLPAKLPSVKAAYPNLKLFIREDLTPRLIAALKAGQIDAAVIALPYEAQGIEHARIGDDEIMAAAPHDHALAAPGPIRPGSLKAQDLILLEDGHCLRDHALAALDIEAPRGDDVFAATSLHTLVQMVGSGLGVSFLPRMAVQAGLADNPSVAIRPFEPQADGAPPRREIVVAWRSGSSRAAEAKLLAEAMAMTDPAS